jgi:WD40 repeat protein
MDPGIRQLIAALASAWMGALLFSGCGWLAPERPYRRPRPPQAAAPTPSESLVPSMAPAARRRLGGHLFTPLDQLTQYHNGAGVAVCPPVVAGKDRDLRQFGAGCSRWLQFAVGGHGELGKTPAWTALERVLQDLEIRGTPPTLAGVSKFPRRLGVTHVVVGELSGSVARSTLTYHLWKLPERVQVGAPVKLSGSLAEVTKGLPAAARELAKRLGVAKPRVPAQIGESAADLRFLGSIPRSRKPLPAAGAAKLRVLQGHSLLGKLLLAGDATYRGDQEEVIRMSDQASRKVTDNTVVWGMIGSYCSQMNVVPTEPGDTQNLRDSLKRFPQNFQLNAAAALYHYQQHPAAEYVASAEEAVRCSTRSPVAWTVLAVAISTAGDSIRRARTVNELSPQELADVNGIYPHWLEVAERAARMDPDWPDAWITVSQAAAFAGDPQEADQAFWKGLRGQHGNARTYWWGMEMYAPKWYSDPKKLDRVAKLAAQDQYATSADRSLVLQQLQGIGRTDLASKLAETTEERTALSKLPQTQTEAVSPGEGRKAREKEAKAKKREERTQALAKNRSVTLLYEHDDGVAAVAWSPDGSRLASAGKDGVAKIWEARGGRTVVLRGHSRPLHALAWSPDGRRLATAGSDGTVRLWNAETGTQEAVLKGHVGPVRAVTWSPDGALLASGGADRVVRLWDSSTGTQARSLRASQGAVWSLAWSPDGSSLAIASDDPGGRVVRLADLAGKSLRRLDTVLNVLYALAWSPDGKRLAVAELHGVGIWDPKAGKRLQSADTGGYHPLSLAWSRDGSRLAYCGGERKFHLLSAATGEETNSLPDPTGDAVSFAWAPDGRLASGGGDGAVLLWDLKSAKLEPPRAVVNRR